MIFFVLLNFVHKRVTNLLLLSYRLLIYFTFSYFPSDTSLACSYIHIGTTKQNLQSQFNPTSKKLDGCLIQLAGRYATTKFIRIKAREVDFDEEVCPTVLVYRAGDLIANLVMISYELSEDFDSTELEELLTK